MTKDNNWHDFYAARVNSTYQDYFEEKYAPFLELITSRAPAVVFEAGCGIGSVSKCLLKHEIPCYGIDLCDDTASLANTNVGKDIFTQGDLFKHSTYDLTVTHGVLEHFTDAEILRIASLYPNSIHYVPLDKYVTPSFGDERLLPAEYWRQLLKPSVFEVFNDGYDLMFKL